MAESAINVDAAQIVDMMVVPAFPKDVSVGIVSHNGLHNDKLPRTLQALREAGCPDEQITIVDVASNDGQQEWIENNWPNVNLVEQATNSGPGPGRNLLIRTCEDDFLLLMDSDGQICADTVEVMRRVAEEDASIAIVSPLVLYGDDPSKIQYSNAGLHVLGEACIPWQGKRVRARGEQRYDVGVAPACVLLLRCEILRRLDLFDERYFVCKEDGDFIHRVNIAGYRVIEDPRAKVIHNCTLRTDSMFRRQLANGWHLIFKNYQKRTLILLCPLIGIHAAMQFLLLSKKGYTRTYFGAIRDFGAYLPTLARDRASVCRLRRRHDTDILRCDDMLVREDMRDHMAGKMIHIYSMIVRAYWRVVCLILYPVNGPARPTDPEQPPKPFVLKDRSA